MTISRYNDSKSVSLVKKFVNQLINRYPFDGSKHLTLSLHNYSLNLKQINSTKSLARVYLTAFKLSLCVNWNQTNDDIKNKLIETQAIICTVITGTNSSVIINKAYKKLKNFWKSIAIEEYVDSLAKLSENCDQSIALHLTILWDFVIKYASELRLSEFIAKYKPIFRELFIKHIIGTKTKLSNDLITVGMKYQLKQITHEDFSNLFLPSIQKSVLRNSEVVLNLIGFILKGLSLDLSPYALEIGKLVASQLHSKDDTLRIEAISATKYLAQQCSNSSAIEALLKHYFAVLNGSEGKLTIAVQRYGVISGIGALSYHSVSGEAQALSEMASELFVNVLKQEVHEATILHITSQLQLWCNRLVSRIPNVLIDWFKSLQTLKTSTAYVKSAYISCLYFGFKQNMSEQANDILSILTNSAQKSFTSTVSQMPLLNEGLYATCLILKVCNFNKQYEAKVKSVFNGIFETEKLAFLSEKFISSASEETLQILINFIDALVFNYENKLNDKMKPLYRALLLLMTHPISYSVRKQAFITCKKLTSNSINSSFNTDLVKEFASIFKDLSIHQNDCVSSNFDETQQNSEVQKQPSISALIECHDALLSYCTDEQNIKSTLLAALYSAHINPVFKVNPNLWINSLRKRMESKFVDNFVKENQEIIVRIVLKDIDDNQIKSNAVKALVKFAPHDFIPIFLDKAVNTLTKPDFKIITQTDYEIYLAPEGELYEKTVLDKLKSDDFGNKNVKRESKLYSYKDQMEEIELRKELEAKKKAQGDYKEPQLNKKQLEVKQQQLQKESQIRSKLRANFEEFSTAIDLIQAMADSNPTAITIYINEVIFALINLFSSPLCAEKATKLFAELRKSIFNQNDSNLKRFGDSLAYLTLRQLKPFCEIDKEWTHENLSEGIERLISFLHKRTCRPTGRDYDEKTAQLAIKLRLTAPAFTYCFPLIQSLLLSPETSETQIFQSLQIISEHTQMRTNYNYAIDDLEEEAITTKDPQYLPRKQMFDTIIKVISKSPIHIEQNASKVFLDIALCANGTKGCAKATFDEVLTLLEALKSSVDAVRISALNALHILSTNVLVNINDENSKFILTHRVFVAQFDPLEECAAQAQQLFGDCHWKTSVSLCNALLDDIIIGNSILRHSVAGAMEALLSEYPDQTSKMIVQLMNIYREKAKVLPPLTDSFGRSIANSQVDNYEPRLGVALVLTQIAPLIPNENIEDLAKFFVPEALGDRNESVQSKMLEAGCALVNLHGKDNVNLLLNVFEKFLDEAPDSSANDVVRRSVVVLMGTLARHIDKDNPKVKPIVAKLIEALSTPSQMVQEAVANCLPYLIPVFKEEAPSLLQKLIQLLLESDSYGERKGAAYGIAGIIKGLGILSLKQLGIMDALTDAIQDKKNPNHREGALFAFEMLCSMLGRLFEPYIVHILPHLLLCFGDTSTRVRQATDDTAKQVMSKLSAHGVKLVLPSLLDALEEDSWRTKAGSIELLGAMAYCAPKQLSSCLPSIVPKLMTVISDSHPKVQKTAAQALKQIGSVIRNPEIQAIVPVLLEALQDPANKTSKCLNTMLNTKFVHFIDAPSLALIMPVVERAFQGRSTETRKMAAQIIGNMYALTDQKDLSPYLPSIIPGLKQSLLDPVPEVRGVTARALGAMVKGMGEDIFEDLMPWLMSTLTSETSSVDRSGAAQGLSEVMGGLGLERLEKFIPEIIATAERTDVAPHVKDGYIMLFIYLPMVFTQDFTVYIGRIINPVLKALADENEFVRETALRAGQRIVNMYAETAIQLLLPELERGLFDENWRIRYSSVQLLGDLLFKISGVSGKMTTETADEDDNFGTEQSHRAIMSALGGDRRNRVLSGLYMGRSDVSLQVRQAALHVWKVVVTNTPRTLKEILPTLFSLLLGCLASHSCDKQQVAARTLGDLVRKLGERILPEIIPILEQGLESDRSDQRQGVCIGLSEIMASTSREMVQAFVDSLVPTVKKALFDPLPEVRQAAAKTFDSLHSAVGVRALDEILPALLNQLGDQEKGEYTLDGLRQVMAIKSKVVLPYLVPQVCVCIYFFYF
jgi:HEAT repeat protein